MKFLGFAQRFTNPSAVIQTLHARGIAATGPYRTPKGIPIYILTCSVVTERELLDLANAGKLDATGVSELVEKIMKHGPA
jgi:hypothetical protein